MCASGPCGVCVSGPCSVLTVYVFCLQNLLNPHSNFYSKLAEECVDAGVGIDLFMSTTSYSDLATIGHCIATTGGELRYYPMFKVSDPNCPLVTGCIVHWSQVVLSTGHRLYCPLVTGCIVHWSQVVLSTGHRLYVHWSQVVLSTGHRLYCPLVTGCMSTGHRLFYPLVTGCIVHWSQVVLSTGHRLYCPLVTGCIVHWSQVVLSTGHRLYCEHTLMCLSMLRLLAPPPHCRPAWMARS